MATFQTKLNKRNCLILRKFSLSPRLGSSLEALLVLLLKEDAMLGLVLMELRLLSLLPGLTVGWLLLPPELSSEFSSMLVSLHPALDPADFRKLFTASLLFIAGILARSLS